MKKPYILSIKEIEQKYKTNINTGLLDSQIKDKLKEYGPNTLPESKKESLFSIFLSQFKSPLIYVLLIAAIIAFFFAESKTDAIIITAIVILNSIIGTILEGRAQNVLASLRKYLTSETQVIRNSKREIIDTTNLVPGDIIILTEGDKVPADARIIEAKNLKIDEAILTGESQAVSKSPEELYDEVQVYAQKNMVFKGTSVLSGNAKAIVTSTGLNTEIGQIHESIQTIETQMPLQKQISKLSNWIIIFISILCIIIFLAGIFFGKSLINLIYITITLFVSVIPEGLPVVLTITLAQGAYKMAKQHMLVKKLSAAEGLGRTDILLIDKTGTLTRNEMTVLKVYANNKIYNVTGQGYSPEGQILDQNQPIKNTEDNQDLSFLKQASILLDKSSVQYKEEAQMYQIKGEPLEAAMGVLGQKLGGSKQELEAIYTEIFEIPFDPELRMHIAIYKNNQDNSIYLFAAGAPEYIIKACKFKDDKLKEQSKEILDNFLKEGLRVIALAYKKLEHTPDKQNLEKYIKDKLVGQLNFLSLLGIQDAIRQNLAPVVKAARESGVEIIMLTGDHKETARYVAQQTGIINSIDKIIEGPEVEKANDQELLKLLSRHKAFARVTPQNKLRIAELLKKQDKIVAMTGDGVNDAPSVIAANLGIAMGISGTEVTKKAADLILLDDSLGSIVSAIELGRHIFYTLRRVIMYLFATNLGEILIILFSVLSNLPLPLVPVQILWLNLVTDGFLDLSLTAEPKEANLLHKTWLKKAQSSGIIDKSLLKKIIFMAIIMTIGTFILFLTYLNHSGYNKARTIALCTMAAFQWFNAWNCRSETMPLLRKNLFSNIWLILATILVISLQMIAVYMPFMQKLLHTTSLNLNDWLLIILTASSILVLEEIRKLYYYNKNLNSKVKI